MKIVLDTNVLISGIFFKGPPYQILDAWRNGRLTLIVSPEILLEYQRVANILKHKYSKIDIHPILELIMRNAKFITSNKIDEQVTDDPDDEKFIECAITGNVSIIISGDNHLLKVSGYAGIQVLKPKDFVVEYLKDEA
jgi:putative PIN family toxin of toxin-antitoxin system